MAGMSEEDVDREIQKGLSKQGDKKGVRTVNYNQRNKLPWPLWTNQEEHSVSVVPTSEEADALNKLNTDPNQPDKVYVLASIRSQLYKKAAMMQMTVDTVYIADEGRLFFIFIPKA